MKLDKQSYEKYFKGFVIADCVVRARDLLYFVTQQDYVRAASRTGVVVCAERPGIPPWSGSVIKGMRNMRASVSYHPKEQFVGVSAAGSVYVLGSGEAGLEEDLQAYLSKKLRDSNPPDSAYLLRSSVVRLRTIGGRVYACGGNRTVIDRVGKDVWNYHLSLPMKTDNPDAYGFQDIDGFSPEDMYAVGGKGDVWHFDGQQWKQLPFPSEMTLSSVCCAPDGTVYIGAESGTVFKGRADQWAMLALGYLARPFKDMVWHRGAVWCTNADGLWTITDGELKYADAAPEVSSCSGHLSVGDGVMLLAGEFGAALHDGQRWQRIIDCSAF